MGCCPGRKGKEGKVKSTSIDTGALVVIMMMTVMIFSPVCECGCHPRETKEREAIETGRKERILETR